MFLTSHSHKLFKSPKPNKNRISVETDKQLCKFLLSPYRNSSLRTYKTLYNFSFPELPKDISNGLYYLKKDFETDKAKFDSLCDSYGIKKSALKQIPTSPSPQLFKQERKMTYDSKVMRLEREHVNFERPSLNRHGMMWFQNDDVEIGDSYNSILTIYQPLFDARDQDNVELYLDKDNPTILRQVFPNVPTFMERDHNLVHELEDKCNLFPELNSSVKKAHKKHVYKMHGRKEFRMQATEYELPFSLSLNSFGPITHTDFKIKKHYRTLIVEVDSKRNIDHTCAFVYWKILIDGESTNFGEMKLEDEDVGDDDIN